MSLPDAPTAPASSANLFNVYKVYTPFSHLSCVAHSGNRVGRPCHYEEDSYTFPQSSGPYHSQSLHSRSDDGAPSQAPSAQGLSPNVLFSAPASAMNIDPFRHEALRQPTVNIAVSNEVSKILGTYDDIHSKATKYFATIGQRMPIVSKVRFFERLPSIFSNPQADFLVVCLAMNLILQYPIPGDQSMQSSSYVVVKSFISVLESTSFLSLDVVQARLLVTFYELGHGIQGGASLSIAGAASSARFICLCNGDSLCTTEDPQSSDSLPIEDTQWAQDIVPDTTYHTLATPSDITVGHFARECQISHLIGRVLKHVFEPASDPEFHAQEAMQLEKTLMAFMPLLIEEHSKFGLYCAALGMCSSALFTLYDSALFSSQISQDYKDTLLASIQCSSTQITEFSRHLFGDVAAVDFGVVSPLIPHSLYQAAIVQYRLGKQIGEMRYRNGFESLKEILGYFNRRWLIGGRYLEALEGLKVDFPVTTLPLSGIYVSPSGPRG
ncbi:hypothetical protein BKA65DRAFT_602133 [Rhexocercosporidium sp. MPI-PUGE-AT-0058]|nr:hypothetical protein BKA65DRAFT_602133 [Rhexocercosporidium sp. MPI-PUGE-AT-0058]